MALGIIYNKIPIYPIFYLLGDYILGLYWDNGKENGNYYSIIGCIYICET